LILNYYYIVVVVVAVIVGLQDNKETLKIETKTARNTTIRKNVCKIVTQHQTVTQMKLSKAQNLERPFGSSIEKVCDSNLSRKTTKNCSIILLSRNCSPNNLIWVTTFITYVMKSFDVSSHIYLHLLGSKTPKKLFF
jgi:hypothetical protein